MNTGAMQPCALAPDKLRARAAKWYPDADAVIRLSKMPTAATGKVDKLRLRSQYGRV